MSISPGAITCKPLFPCAFENLALLLLHSCHLKGILRINPASAPVLLIDGVCLVLRFAHLPWLNLHFDRDPVICLDLNMNSAIT